MFNKYPYTDMHELNLDYILAEVKRVTEEWITYQKSINARFDSMDDAFKDLKDFVINYFDRTDFKQLVADEIEKYIDDGTIAAMVDNEINLATALHLTSNMDIGPTINNYIKYVNGSELNGRTFYMPAGTWTINTPIQIDASDGKIIHCDNGCVFRSDGVSEMFVFSSWDWGGTHRNLQYKTGIEGGTIDAENVTKAAIAIRWAFQQGYINNMTIKNLKGTVVGIQVGTVGEPAPNNNLNMQEFISNVNILGKYKDEDGNLVFNGYGMNILGTDGYYLNIDIVFCKHGIHQVTGANKMTNVHIACGQEQYADGLVDADLEDIYAIGARGGKFVNVQTDNYYIGFKVWAEDVYDVEVTNYTYNVETREVEIFDKYMNKPFKPTAFLEIPNQHEGINDQGIWLSNATSGNCLRYDLRPIRKGNASIHSHRVLVPSGKSLFYYPYITSRPKEFQSVYTHPKSVLSMTLIDDAFRLYSNDTIQITCPRDSYNSSKWYLIGYVGSYVNTAWNLSNAKFNISYYTRNADIDLRITGQPSAYTPEIVLNATVNEAFTDTRTQLAVDTGKPTVVDGLTYYPIYIKNNTGNGIRCPFVISSGNVFMPGLYFTRNKPLTVPANDEFIVDALVDETHIVNLY